jgi:hypothetical protein
LNPHQCLNHGFQIGEKVALASIFIIAISPLSGETHLHNCFLLAKVAMGPAIIANDHEVTIWRIWQNVATTTKYGQDLGFCMRRSMQERSSQEGTARQPELAPT